MDSADSLVILAPKPARSMQLDSRLEPMPYHAAQRIDRDAQRAMNRHLVHLVERRIHPARDQPLDEQVAAEEAPHQVADGGQLAQRNERAEIGEMKRRERLAGEPRFEVFREQRRLLMR